MICPLCLKVEARRLKIEKGVEIFECVGCKLGFVKKENTISSRSYQDGKGLELYDFAGYKREEEKLTKRFERLVKIILEYKKSGSVLDVGAGFGLFSSILVKNGRYQVDIIEPNVELFYLREVPHDLYKISLEKFLKLTKLGDRGGLSMRKQKKLYDLIILLDVIEHLENPIECLRKLRLHLVPRGILVIQTPNYKSLMARICKKWAWWMIEDHKYFFSPKSIKLILKKAGFKELYFSTYEDWEDFRINLDGNFEDVKNKLLRKILKATFVSLFIPTYFVIRNLSWKAGRGGLIFVIAKKC